MVWQSAECNLLVSEQDDKSLLCSIKTFVADNCVIGGDDERLISPSGGKLSWLIDMRVAFLDATPLDIISTLFWRIYKDFAPIQIGGMEVAAVPLVTALIMKAKALGLDSTGFIIRKERKRTGRARLIEGNLNDRPIVIVDDLINSGKSFEKVFSILTSIGKRPASAFAVIDYQSKKGLSWRVEREIKIESLLNLHDLGLKLRPDRKTAANSYNPRWRFAAPGGHAFSTVPKSSPTLHKDRLFFGTDSGIFYALESNTGKISWKFDTKTTGRKGIWSSPCYNNGKIYFGAYNGNLYCLKASDGEEHWVNSCCDWIGSSPVVCQDHGLLIVGLEYERPRARGSVAAFTLDSGKKVWETWLTAYQHGSGAYWPDKGLVVFGTNDHTVEAYDVTSGDRIWSYKTIRSVKSAPTIDQIRGLVCCTSSDGAIHIIDAESGRERTQIKTDNFCYTTPLIVDNILYCGSGDKHLYIIDLDSLTLIKKLYCGSRVYSAPRRYGNSVLFGTNGGIMFELDSKTTDFVGRIQLPDAITNSICVSDDGRTLYIPTYMNEIYAFDRC